MHILRWNWIGFGFLIAICAAEPAEVGQRELKPEPAVPAIMKLFEKHSIVGLSDLHGCAELLAFLEHLVSHPEFGRNVDDITWELGNVRYQSLMDEFISDGKDVPFSKLCKCWRENTQVHTYGDTPALYRLLQTIQKVNKQQKPEHRVRVLLIDPPVDWSKVTSKDDLRKQNFDRESHMAEVLEREVYAKGRKALFFAGGAHLGRERNLPPLPGKQGPTVIPFPGPTAAKKLPPGDRGILKELPRAGNPQIPETPRFASPLARLERRHPGTTINVLLHEGFGERIEEFENRLDAWPTPGLALIRGTWYGGQHPAPSADIMFGPDGKRIRPPTDAKIEDRWDAVLFLGKRHELTRVSPPGQDVLDTAWMDELARRQKIKGSPPAAVKDNRASTQFFPD